MGAIQLAVTSREGGGPVEAERITPGRVVISRAGRDAGQCYVVVALLSDSRVALADGVGRRMANPKRKNIKHLKLVAAQDPEVERKFANGERITDADIRRVLWVLMEKEGCQ